MRNAETVLTIIRKRGRATNLTRFGERSTGELITVKVVRSVRRGAEGKGRNRVPRQRPTQRKQSRPMLAAMAAVFRGSPFPIAWAGPE